MAETSALPTGFGELEVLAVGMVLLVEDPGAADSLPPAGAELGSCGQWDQPERPHCSHIQPSPCLPQALALRFRWLPGSRLPGLCNSVGQHLQQCSYRLGALSSLLHPPKCFHRSHHFEWQ
uniref:Retinal G protein coupled receptor n=1 Tax=Cercocebus atys TaxID=9531 RepID=A0A2K5N5D0_CERAT